MGSVMEVTYRPLAAEDLGAVVALELSNQVTPWTEGIFRDELAADDRVYLVAESGEIIGFGGVMVVGEEAHVTNLLVEPGARRHGIGLGLMIRLIDRAVDLGARHLTLEVRAGNEAARALYSRLGLVPVGARPGYYGDEDALILWAHDVGGHDFQTRLEELR